MKKIYPMAVLVCFSILLAASCNLSSLNDPIVVPDVEDEFYLELWESFSAQGRQLEWKLRTIEPVDCEDALISFSFTQRAGQELALSINEIVSPGDCVPPGAPAAATVEVGALPNGDYPVSVALRATVSREGELSVSQDLYQIEVATGGGIIPLRNELHRIPEGTIWGYASYSPDRAVAQAFEDELRALSSSQGLALGYYGYFRVEPGELEMLGAGQPAEGAVVFQRQLEAANRDAVVSLIESYRANYPDITIAVWNTLGETW